jgi:hypothetical protein
MLERDGRQARFLDQEAMVNVSYSERETNEAFHHAVPRVHLSIVMFQMTQGYVYSQDTGRSHFLQE